MGIRNLFALASLALCLSLSSTSFADQANTSEHENRLHPLFAIGLSVGGDELAKVRFDDGSNEEVDAGGLFDLKAGLSYRFKDSAIELQTSIGYFTDFVLAENGDLSFDRYPLELLGFYNQEKHRVGLGLSYHLSPQLDIDALGINRKIHYKEALGSVVEYGYRVEKNLVLGLRSVFIDYQIDEPDLLAEDFSGNHIGIYAYLTL